MRYPSCKSTDECFTPLVFIAQQHKMKTFIFFIFFLSLSLFFPSTNIWSSDKSGITSIMRQLVVHLPDWRWYGIFLFLYLLRFLFFVLFFLSFCRSFKSDFPPSVHSLHSFPNNFSSRRQGLHALLDRKVSFCENMCVFVFVCVCMCVCVFVCVCVCVCV